MNLRKKIANRKNHESLRSAADHVLRSLAIFISVFASIFSSIAEAKSSNTISVPMIVSLPSDSVAIEKSVIQLANSTFQSGFDWNQTLADVNIADPFPVKLTGVNLKSRVSGRLDRDAKGLIIEAQMQSPEISIGLISIHTVIETKVSGVEARIRVDAECKDTKITWPSQTLAVFARARLSTNPQLALDVSSSALPADLPKPEMNLSCTGPFGMDAMIRDYAWTALQERWLEDSFARDIETQVETAFADMMKPGGAGLSLLKSGTMGVTLRPSSFEVASNGAHLRATLDMSLDRPLALAATAAPTLIPPASSLDTITFTVAASSVQTLVQEWFAPSVWSQWLEGRAIEGFRDLMSSRFQQFFAFPDLMNYDKTAPFWFAVNTYEKPTLRCSGSSLQVNAPVGAWLMLQVAPSAEYAMGYKPLVYFSAPTQVAVTLPSVKTKKSMVMSLQSMSLTAQFDAGYIRRENPNTSIATDTILGSVEESAQEILSNPSSLGEGVGSLLNLLNQTNTSCGSDQMMRVSF